MTQKKEDGRFEIEVPLFYFKPPIYRIIPMFRSSFFWSLQKPGLPCTQRCQELRSPPCQCADMTLLADLLH